MQDARRTPIGAGGCVRIDGCRLEAAWFGPPPGRAPTLVLLHEGLGCVAMWKDFPRRLAEASGCGVFAYSRSGYAGSDPCPLPRPVSYMHREALAVLPRVLDAVAVQEAILVGHSDGGSIALLYCGAIADARVRGAATLGAHVFVEDVSVAAIAEARQRYQAGELAGTLAKYHGEATERVFRGWNDVWLDPAFRAWNIEPYLPGIRVPLLVIQGTHDPYGSAAQVQAIARQAGAPVEALMLPDCRHWPHLERETETLAAVARFSARVLGGAAHPPAEFAPGASPD